MADIAQILSVLEEIRVILAAQANNRVGARDVVVVSGLSDISEKLGLVQAGEFRVGNSKEPGFGFTGVRMGYPPFTYISETWHLAGVNNDTLMFGLRATDGKAYFAAGTAVIDNVGIKLRSGGSADPSETAQLYWTDSAGSTVGKIIAYTNTTPSPDESGIAVIGLAKSVLFTPVAHLMTSDHNNAFITGIEIRGDGEIQVDLRTATSDAGGSQKVRIMTNMSVTNSPYNDLFILEASSKGTAANGFGSSMAWYTENGSGNLVKMGYIYCSYTDVTNGSEDSKIVAGYLLNGSFTEVQLAP